VRSSLELDGPADPGPIVGTSLRAGILRATDSRDQGLRTIVPHVSGIRQDTGHRARRFSNERPAGINPSGPSHPLSNNRTNTCGHFPPQGRRRAHRPPIHRRSSMNIRGAAAARHPSGPPTRRRSPLPPRGRTGDARHRSAYLRFNISRNDRNRELASRASCPEALPTQSPEGNSTSRPDFRHDPDARRNRCGRPVKPGGIQGEESVQTLRYPVKRTSRNQVFDDVALSDIISKCFVNSLPKKIRASQSQSAEGGGWTREGERRVGKRPPTTRKPASTTALQFSFPP
jgi:hypothetical protein